MKANKYSSYTVLCNITNGYCQCYDTENTLIGCLQQRNYGEGCYPSQQCSTHQNLQCNLSIYQCQCPLSTYFDGEVCLSYSSYLEPCYDSSSCLPNTQLMCS